MRAVPALVLSVSLSMSACGDDLPGLPDGLPPCLPAPNADADTSVSGDYDDPSDFVLVGCDSSTMVGFNPTGVWHASGEADYGGFPLFIAQVQRINDCGASGTVSGLPADIRVTDQGVFVWWSGDWGFGTVVHSFFGCRVDPDGTLWGPAARCDPSYVVSPGQDPCVVGAMTAYRVLPPEPEEASGLTLLGEHAGAPAWPDPTEAHSTNVRVRDGIAYVSRLSDGLRIVDVSDSSAMRDLAWVEGSFNDVKLVDRADGVRFALAAGRSTTAHGVVSIDVSDPTAPIEAAHFSVLGRTVHTIFVETLGAQTRAYLMTGLSPAIGVFDVTDPANPVELGIYTVLNDLGSSTPHDAYVENGFIYVDDFVYGLIVLDATDPANITQVGTFADGPGAGHSSWGTTLGGCRHLVAGGEGWDTRLDIIGVDPACPGSYLQLVGALPSRRYVSVHNVMAFEDRAYVSWYQDGVRIIDLSDPAGPAVIAWFNTWDPADPFAGRSFYDGAIGLDVDLAADRIYVADTLRGLLVLQITP